MSPHFDIWRIASGVLENIRGPPRRNNRRNRNPKISTNQNHGLDFPLGRWCKLLVDYSYANNLRMSLGRHSSCQSECLPRGIILSLDPPRGCDNPQSDRTLRYALREFNKLKSVTVKATFTEHEWNCLGLDEGFNELGRLLTLVGEEYLSFDLWDKLSICLPHTELAHDPTVAPIISPRGLMGLRRLSWTGHSSLLVKSWLPLSPPLLQRLSVLKITCEIALEDCVYIFSNIPQVTRLYIENIEEPSMITPVFPPMRSDLPFKRIALPMLDNLTIVSETDICPLLLSFSFPSLRHLTLTLYNCANMCNIGEIDTINWRQLKRLEVDAYGSNSYGPDAARMSLKCGPYTITDFSSGSRPYHWSPYTQG